jgi:hypothetical protein
MSTCDDDSVDRQIPAFQGVEPFTVPSPDASILVEHQTQDQRIKLSARWDADVHSAVVEGLAAYVSGLQTAIAGRVIFITRVITHWAFPGDGPVQSPAGAVYSIETGVYEGNQPGAPENIEAAHPNKRITLSSPAIYELDGLQVSVICEDDVQRRGVRHMLEDAFYPTTWMEGFRLILPRYHNAVAEFQLKGAQQPDASDEALSGRRPLVMTLKATCPVYRVHEMPLAHIAATTKITSNRRI